METDHHQQHLAAEMCAQSAYWTGRSCLVLGAGGFLGSWLVDELSKHGADVRGYGRISQLARKRTDITWYANEFNDHVSLARAVEGVEVVFHLLGGGTPESSNADPYSDLLAGPGATLNLLNICRTEGVRRFVFASSGGTVYGVPESTPIPEAAPTNPISAYGVSKLMTEKYLLLFKHLYGFNCTVMRISNPYGPYQNPFRRQGVVAAIIHKVLSGKSVEIWGDGKIVRDFIFIRDLTDAFLRAAEYQGPVNVFNIGSGKGMSIHDVAHSVVNIIGDIRSHIAFKPGRAVDVPVNVLDTTLAERELGWTSGTAWTDGINITADWIRSIIRNGS